MKTLLGLLFLSLLCSACQRGAEEEGAYDSHVSMALVLLREGQTQAGLEQLAKSPQARDTSETPAWLAETVSLLLARRELDFADSLLQRYPHVEAEFPELEFQRANLHELRGELREADAVYETLVKDPTWSTDALVKRAMIALLEGRASDARNFAKSIVDQDPVHHRARTILAQALLAEGDPESAYEQIIRTPTGRTRFLVEGEALLRSGRAEEALMPLGELYKAQASLPRPRLLLGEAYLELGRLDEARTLLQPLAADEQPFEESQMLLARVERESGHAARADSLDLEYRRVRRWREAMSLRNEGLVFSRQGDLDQALDYFERAREILPDEPDLWNDLGAIYARLERYDEAEQSFLEAVDRDPGNPSAHRNLANLYNILGRDGDRDTHMQTYLRLVAERDREGR